MKIIARRQLIGTLDLRMIDATAIWIQSLGAEFGFSHNDTYRMDLCFAELVTNIVDYSASRHAGQLIELDAVIHAQSVSIVLTDQADAFNPLDQPPPPVATSLDELQVGGFGIALVREFSSAQHYRRIDGKNRMALRFDLEQPITRSMLSSSDTLISELAGLLAGSQMFRGVSPKQIELLMDGLPIQDIAGRVDVLKSGEENNVVLVVLQGHLKVYLDQPGQGDYIELGVGEHVGEMSVIDDRPASAHVIAEPGARLLVIDKDVFLNRILATPMVLRNMLSTFSERMRQNNQKAIKAMRREIELEQVQRELHYAKSIQESLLPKPPFFPDDRRVDCAARMRVVREVGGDFYDVFKLDARHVFFVIADVCGKGLPAALYMVRALVALRTQAATSSLSVNFASELMEKFNRQLCAYNDAQQFLTAFCGILDLETRLLRYVNAGHNTPALALGGQPFVYLDEPINPFIGMLNGLSYQAGEITLTPDSSLVLYTDGVTEAEDGAGQLLGEVRLLSHLNACEQRAAGFLVERVFDSVRQFTLGVLQSDDIAVLVIHCP